MLEIADIFKALFSGLLEGLTEFLPVSSTAHLLLFSLITDFNSIKNNLFEILIQFGAILAVMIAYRKKIFAILFEINKKNNQHLLIALVLAFIPAVIFGALFHNIIKQIFFSSFSIALALIIGGIVMMIVDHKDKSGGEIKIVEKVSFMQALIIGCFQVLAMIPGVSRSGSTIIGGLIVKLDRKTATDFSFLLSIPTIFAASVFDLYKNYNEINEANFLLILIGFLAAFFSAMLVIRWFISYVSKHSFVPFAIYRIILGSAILFFVL